METQEGNMDIVNQAKNIGTILAAAASIAYISGYLALRARSNALGTDPGFTIIDEAYVFSGFRFVFITLIIILCLTPAFLLFKFLAEWLSGHLSPFLLNFGQWVFLVVTAILALMSVTILNVNNLLLQKNAINFNSGLKGAIMGTQPVLGLFLIFGIVFLAMLSAYWLKVRVTSGFDSLTGILCIVVTILLFMVPIFHGALFADRKIRLLADTPEALKSMNGPVGVIDHTREHYTLLGKNRKGDLCLSTIKLDGLYGISVKEVVRLKNFMGLMAQNTVKYEKTFENNNKQEIKMESKESNTHKSFFATLAEQLYMAFESIASLGDGDVENGQLWAVRIDVSGKPMDSERYGTMSDLSWPVIAPDGATIYTLQEGKVIKLSNDYNSTVVINSNAMWIKLLGVTKDGDILGLVYADNQPRPARILKTGDLLISPVVNSAEDKKKLSRLMHESRSYSNGNALYIDRSERGGRGFDVYFKTGDDTFNVSDCGDDKCGQASFAPDNNLVLFIRQTRF